jgi:hypothetical protein
MSFLWEKAEQRVKQKFDYETCALDFRKTPQVKNAEKLNIYLSRKLVYNNRW